MLYWHSLSSLIADRLPSMSRSIGVSSLNVMLYWQSLLPDSWHHDRLPSMSCSIGSLSSLIPGIAIAFPQCHALLAVSSL